METLAKRLRSSKYTQENRSILGKDGVKRMAESLPDNGGKKRILGDITNKSTSNLNSTAIKIVRDVKKTSPDSGIDILTKKVSPIKVSSKSSITSINSTNSVENETFYTTAREDLHDSAIDVTLIKKEVYELPKGVQDFDANCTKDPYSVAPFARDIFNYYKEREKHFPIVKYLDKQPEMNRSMRAILVDWMVEVQESFELNHETLYLAVKLVDLYLMKQFVPKSKLQLIGATAVFVASKFDERMPPLVDDFLYICDDSYSRQDLIDSEKIILKAVDYDLGIPVSYRFLRRYARCSGMSMATLTLARYILETSLMDYELIQESDSKVAAAALLLALRMKSEAWSATLEFYTGFSCSELEDLLVQLNKNISGPSNKHLQTIHTKYSHKVFFEVTKIPPLKLGKVNMAP